MSEAEPMLAILRQAAHPDAVAAIERLIREGADHDLSRVNVLAFAARNHLSEELAIAAFLHAARVGLFEMSWNVLCPGCGGVLHEGTSLKSINWGEYRCAFCAVG